MVHSQKFNALRVRLQNAQSIEINDVLEQLLNFPENFEVLVPIVVSKIQEGLSFSDDHLVSLLLNTRNAGLYEKVKHQVLKNPWSALNLYKGRYPDKQIEELLCKSLYQIATQDANPLRRYIVYAMQEVGSGEVLPTLEALVFDLMPSAKIRTIFIDALEIIAQFEATSRISFLQAVEQAIDQIKTREASVTEKNLFKPDDVARPRLPEAAHEPQSLSELQSHFDPDTPVVCVMLIRRAAEGLAKDSYRRLGCEKNGKPARRMMFDDLLKPLRDGGAPDMLIYLLQTLQLFGNFAAHDQGDQSFHLTKEIASALKMLYNEALKSHSEWHSKSGQTSPTVSR